MPPKPTSLLVMCILAIIWSSLGILGGLWGIIAPFLPIGPQSPEMNALKHEGLYLFTVLGLGCLSLLCNVSLLAGAIGALKLRKWSRTLLFTYCVATVVVSITALGIQMGYLNNRIFTATFASGSGGVMSPSGRAITIMRLTMIVSTACVLLLTVAWPTYIIIVLARPKVRDAFDGKFVPSNAAFPIESNPYDPR